MSELERETMDLLRAAKRERLVDAATVARVRGAVLARTAEGAVVLASVKATSTFAKGAIGWKASVIAIVSAGAAATALTLPARLPMPRMMDHPSLPVHVVVAPPSPSVSVAPSPMPCVVPTLATRPPEPSNSWSRDLSRLRDAQRALADGQPAAARKIAETMTPNGPFEEERAALVTIAACGAGSNDADRLARAFAGGGHDVALVRRVDDACARSER